MSRPWLGWLGWIVIAAACGGRTDLGTRGGPYPDGGGPDVGADGPHPDGGACDTVGQPCGPQEQCCVGLVCNGGTCLNEPTCEPDGSKCSSALSCCSSQCLQGVCCGSSLPCPACLPVGATCTTGSECCSNSCMGCCCPTTGPCACACESDGSPCSSPSQCCSGICGGGVCGGKSTCPALTPSKCDTCLATSCCTEQQACEADPTCNTALGCYTTCEGKGGTAAYCAYTCGVNSSSAGMSFVGCAQSSCFSSCA